MILRGKPDQFNTVIKEYLNDRASLVLEQVYLEQSKSILKLLEPIQNELNESKTVPVLLLPTNFIPESSYQLKDGSVGVLNETQQESVGKLYKSLNTDNRQRLVKLLAESQESFNRILNLAKIESTKNGNK
jgi:hypothetical protein